MTIRNLDALFKPNAIALVGASNEPNTVGSVLAGNLFETGFAGPVVTVNPHERAIRSTVNYQSVADLPLTPDLAVVATPPPTVPGIIAELGARGCRSAVVITAGLGEGGSTEGRRLLQAMLDAAQPYLLRIVGPNCLGFISPGRGINASFSHITPPAGDLAFVTQSGALAAVLDWAAARGFGFSHVISVGDMADVDFGDLLDYLALDPATRAILLYVESVTHARKFMSAGRIAARIKPVIVIKSGRSAAGAKAAMSHTGALAGADLVYDAAFRRAGMLRVHELRELFTAVATLSSGIAIGGNRLAILTNGGGAGVLVADALEEAGGELAILSAETLQALDKVLPAAWSRGNPVDILGDADGARYRVAVDALIAERGQDAIIVLNCPTAVTDSLEAAHAVVDAVKDRGRLPLLTCWLGESAAAASRRLFVGQRIPTYETPREAVGAFMHLVEYRRNQDLLMETPPADGILARPDRNAARAVIDAALGERRRLLTEPEAKSVLEAYGVPTVATRVAPDPAAAAAIAETMRLPVVLKILSQDIAHKSDVGGVRLDLETPEMVESAAHDMLATVGRRAPGARIAGFIVEEMIKRPGAHELLLGVGHDRVFGPILLVGHGGIAAEAIGDRAIGLPPLNPVLAREMIDRTRVARLLRGFRDQPAVNVDAVAAALVALSQLAVDFREISELDVNPLLADETGIIALDARMIVRPAPATDDLAIRAYPADIDHEAVLRSGARFRIRAIRPEDEPKIVDMVARSTEEDIRLRFLGPLKRLPHQMAARLSQIDYDRELALVVSFHQVVHPVLSGEAGVAKLQRFLGGPDEHPQECPSDAAWSRVDCPPDQERADAGGRGTSRRRLPADRTQVVGAVPGGRPRRAEGSLVATTSFAPADPGGHCRRD